VSGGAAGGEGVDIGSLVARGRGLLDAGKYADAVRCLESAVHRQPEFPDLHHLLGLALSMSGEPLRAESHLARAIELNPNYAEAHLNLSILLFERNAYAAARDHLREFNRVVRGDPQAFPDPALDDLARRHADLAERYRGYGILDEAENQLRAALHLRPGYNDLRLLLVRTLFERAKLDEAARHVEILLQQSPEYPDAHLLRGHIELARGNPEAARAAWLQVRRGGAATQARALLDQLDQDPRSGRGGDAPPEERRHANRRP
jgi:tetratricopeptide (TPR) repeat protein